MSEEASFVDSHRPMVIKQAERLRSEYGLKMQLEDLISFGLVGLLEAKERFDPERGVKFSTFAYYRVRGAMVDGVRKMSYLPKSQVDKLHKAQRIDDVLESLGESEASRRSEAGQSAEAARVALQDSLLKISASFVMSAVGQDINGNAEEPEAEKRMIRGQDAAMIHELLPRLPERERQLLEGYYLDGKALTVVGEELGLSKSWASRLHARALDRMRKWIEELDAA